MWTALALLFNAGIYFVLGKKPALEFLAAYFVEKALSVDNVFVFLILFAQFQVPLEGAQRVSFWGSAGSLVMRLGFVLAGVALLERFHWSIYPFGAVLIASGAWLAYGKDRRINLESNLLARVATKFFPITSKYEGRNFFVHRFGHLKATPLFLVLLLVGTTDVVIGVDSVPAVLAISRDRFIIYSSSAFAILGFSWLYFALAEIIPMFRFIHYGLSALLIFLGARMILLDSYKISIGISLTVVLVVLGLSIAASLIWPQASSVPPFQRPTGTNDSRAE